MLIGLLIAFFALHGGDTASPLLGDPGRLEKAIEHQVRDPARLDPLKALVADLKKAVADDQVQRKAALKVIDEVGARQSATAAELEAAHATFRAGQRTRRDRQLALRLRLAALTTPAEWTAIVSEIFPPSPAPAAR
jgi:hypothetical protein